MRHTIVMARTRADLDAAPMFSLIRADLRLYPRLPSAHWDLFDIRGATMANDRVREHAAALGLPEVADAEPEHDGELAPDASDDDAALSYLATERTNTLVKLPDNAGSKYYRLYVPAKDWAAHVASIEAAS